VIFLDRLKKNTYTNINFHENPSSGSRVVSCARTDGRTDITKLIVALLNFLNASEKDVSNKLDDDRSCGQTDKHSLHVQRSVLLREEDTILS